MIFQDRSIAMTDGCVSILEDKVSPGPASKLISVLRAGTALLTLATVAIALDGVSPAFAVDQYWDGSQMVADAAVSGGAGAWTSIGTNWTNDGGTINQPWQTGGTAIFGVAGGQVSVSGDHEFGSLRFTVNGYRLTGGPDDSLVLGSTGGTINVGNGVATEIGMVLAGTGGLTVTGGGVLQFKDWVNTYSGATTIDAGATLQLIGSRSSISASSGLIVNGTFDVSNATAASIKALTGSGSVVLGGTTLFITAASGTFSGIIEGSASISIAGGTQVLTGANTFIGGVGVSSGATLQLGNGGTTGSITGNITNFGTVTFDRSDNFTFAGVISGTGAVQHVSGSTLTLTGANSGSGNVLISNSGTLQFGDGGTTSNWLSNAGGTITIDAGSTLVSNMANSQRVFGKLAGAGDFIKRGSGTITLTGDSSAFAGETIVETGMLNVGYKGNGKLAGPVSVNSGAWFGGSGTVLGNVTIASGATHRVGDTVPVPPAPAVPGLVQTQTITGNYINHGKLEIEATPDAADALTVNGTVDITNATLNLLLSPNDPGVAGGWDPLNGPFKIIANDGVDAVVGQFASVGNLNNLVFLDHLIKYDGGDGNDVMLTLTRNDVTAGSVGQTPNQAGAGAGIDSLPSGSPLGSAMALLTADQAEDALDQLAGDVHSSIGGGSTQASQFLGQFANDRVRSAFGDVAAPDMPVMGYGEGGLELVEADSDRFVVWGQALGNWGSVDGDGNAAGFDHSSGGLVAGADTVVGGDWRVGMLAGYSRTSFEADGEASSGDSDNFHLGVYGGRHFGAVGLRAGAAYTRHAIDTSRTVSFPGLSETLKASYDAGTAQVFVEAGYRAEMGRVAFEPYAGLAYVSTSTDGFSETGGAAALTSDDASFDSTTSTLGLRAATDVALGDANATLRGGLGWRHAFGDIAPSSTVAFAGGDSFTVHGSPIARNALLVEAGLDVAVSPKASLGLTYTGQIANDARDHGAKANLAVKF